MRKFLSFASAAILESYSSRPKHITKLIFANRTMGCTTSSPEKGETKQDNQEEEFVEDVVCNDDDIKENEMKEFDLGERKVLLVRQNGELSALGALCTHYSAHLVNGALGNGRVRCQWHGACFNIKTGDIEDFPGLDSLPCFKVTVENNQVKVRAKKSLLEEQKRVKPMSKCNPREGQHIVVVGGGPSGATCVETLRQEGFAGKITLVCKENCLPYDRVKVSKTMDFEISKAEFRTIEFYREHGIDVLKGVEAVGADTKKNLIKLSNGNELEYDRLYVATGCKASKAPIPGADLQNVVVLRDYDHSKYTNAQLNDQVELVVLGSSFVALEGAFYCSNKVKSVTVVMRSNAPFKPLLGEKVGLSVMELFKQKGIHFIPNSGMKKVIGDANGAVTGVELTDGQILNAQLVIMGVGSTFYTDFLRNSGVDLLEDGTIEVDEYLQTNVPNVYAGGDIVYAPVWSHNNQKSNIGHYPLAHYHGKIAALNMLNKKTKMEAVPYFWTMLFGRSIRYAGHGEYDDILYHGKVEDLKFVAFYLKDDEVVGTSSCSMDPYVSKFAELLAQGKKLYRKDLQGDMVAWAK